MHPKNKRERRVLSKVKAFGKKTTDQSGRLRRKAIETQTVKELDHELEHFAMGQTLAQG